MVMTKNKAEAQPEGVRRGGRPKEVDGDAVEFTIRLGTNQLDWLELRYPKRTRAGLVRDLVDEVRIGSVRRAAHWPPRAAVGVYIDPHGSGVGLVALVTTGSRARLAAVRVLRGVQVEPEALAASVRQLVVDVEAGGDPIDLASIGNLAVQADVSRKVTREQGISWGIAYAALRGAALPVTTPADREVKARATVEAREAVHGWDVAGGDQQLAAAAAFVALAGIDRESIARESKEPKASTSASD